jgi:hypothetical protein
MVASASFVGRPPIGSYAWFQFERGREAARTDRGYPRGAVHISWLQGYELEKSHQ